MKTITVEILKDEAMKLFEELQRLNIIRLIKQDKRKSRGNGKFQALKLDTRGFKFNRDEANER